MTWEDINSIITKYSPRLLAVVVILVVGYILTKVLLKLIKKIFSRTNIEHTVVTFTTSVIKVLFYLIVVLTALSTLGVDISSLIAAVGAAALTAGLALQDSLGNLASGIVILFNKPFVAGDALEFEGIKGKVESIKLFATTLNTFDNKLVTIPNSRLTQNNVINCTMTDKRRLDLKYTVSYDTDTDKAKQLLMDFISTIDKAYKDPAPQVNVGEYLDSAIEIVVWIWVDPDDYFDVYFHMQNNVKKIFDNNGIEIPFPHIVVQKK